VKFVHWGGDGLSYLDDDVVVRCVYQDSLEKKQRLGYGAVSVWEFN